MVIPFLYFCCQISHKNRISDEDSVLALNNWLNDEGLVLNGIIHAAGISYSQWFKDQTLKDIDRAASTKVRGLRY